MTSNDYRGITQTHIKDHQGTIIIHSFSKVTSAASSKYIPSPLFNKVTSTNFERFFSLSPYCCHPKGCWWSFMTFWSQWQKLHKAAQLIRLDVKPWLKNGVEWWFEYVRVVCFKMFPKGPKFEELNVQSIDSTFKDSFQCILWWHEGTFDPTSAPWYQWLSWMAKTLRLRHCNSETKA